jgi:hypothetical protein
MAGPSRHPPRFLGSDGPIRSGLKSDSPRRGKTSRGGVVAPPQPLPSPEGRRWPTEVRFLDSEESIGLHESERSDEGSLSGAFEGPAVVTLPALPGDIYLSIFESRLL